GRGGDAARAGAEMRLGALLRTRFLPGDRATNAGGDLARNRPPQPGGSAADRACNSGAGGRCARDDPGLRIPLPRGRIARLAHRRGPRAHAERALVSCGTHLPTRRALPTLIEARLPGETCADSTSNQRPASASSAA